jgi:hypothetical protein
VPSLRDSPHKLILPGTDVPGYRLFRPRSTSSGQALRDWFVAASTEVSAAGEVMGQRAHPKK